MVQNRSDCQLRLACEPRNRRERLHCLVHHSDKTAHQLADAIGRRVDRLHAYANVNGTDEMPIRDLIALTKATGRTFALRAEVEEIGFLLITRPTATAGEDCFAELIDVFDATGKLAHEFKALAATKDPDQLLAVIAAVTNAQTELAEFRTAAEASVVIPPSLRMAR